MLPAILAPILIEVGKQALILAIAELAPVAIRAVGGAVSGVLKEFGMEVKDDNMVEFGERLLQAKEKGLEMNDGTFDAFFSKIAKFEVDPNITHDESQCLAAAGQTLVGALLNKLPEADGFMEALIKGTIRCDAPSFNARFKNYVTNPHIETIGKYMNGKENSLSKIEEAQNAIAEVEKKVNPQLSDADARQIADQYGA